MRTILSISAEKLASISMIVLLVALIPVLQPQTVAARHHDDDESSSDQSSSSRSRRT